MDFSQNTEIDHHAHQKSIDYWKYEITKNEKFIKKYENKKKSGRKKWNKVTEGFVGFDEIAEVRKRQQDNVYGMSHMVLPTNLFHEVMPKLIEEYGVKDGRDAFDLLLFLHSMTYHSDKKNIDKKLKGWAFPGNDGIIKHLRVSKDRLKKLKNILLEEELIVYKKRKFNGKETDYYLPLFYRYHDNLDNDHF